MGKEVKDKLTKEEYLKEVYSKYSKRLENDLKNINIFSENMIELNENNITFEDFKDKVADEMLKEQTKQSKIEVEDCLKYYKKKDFLITYNEYAFYKELMQMCKDYDDCKNLKIFSQVTMSRIVDYDEKLYFPFNFYSQKSIDFVITNSGNRIKFCIELDGKEHEEDEKRIKSDETKNKILEYIGIKLFRFKNENNIKASEIYEKVKDYIK